MRKFFLLSIIFLLLICTGCSSKSHYQTQITFSSWGSKTETVITKKLLAEFERQNPDINVEFIHTPTNYFQKLHLLFAANLQPDVLFLNNYYFPQYHHYELLENLTPYFQKEIDEGIFFPQALTAFERNGCLYAIPRDVSNVVVYFNKDLFDEYKLTYPTFNWTYSEMIKTARNFKTEQHNEKIYGISFSDKAVFWLPFLAVNVKKQSNLMSFLTEKKALDVLQEYADLPNIYGVAPLKKHLSGQTQAQIFMNGKMAMFIGGRWNIPKFLDIEDFKWDVVPFPSGDATPYTAPIDASGWAISKKSKNKEAALKLLKFLTSAESIATFSSSGLIVPARKDITKSESFVFAKPFIEALDKSEPFVFDKNSKNILENFELKLEPAFNGTCSVKESILGK